jgi:hypothetical protein
MRAVSFLMVGLAAGALACGNGDDASSPVAIAMEAGADGSKGPDASAGPDAADADAAIAPEAGEASPPLPPTQALLRMANWSADSPAVDFCLSPHGTGNFRGPILAAAAATMGEGGVVGALPFPQASSYQLLEPGSYDARLVAAGSVDCATAIVADDTTLPVLGSGGLATIALVGAAHPQQGEPGLELVGFTDELKNSLPDALLIRVINAEVDLPQAEVGTLNTYFTPFLDPVDFGKSSAGDQMADPNGYIVELAIVNQTLAARATVPSLLGAPAHTIVAQAPTINLPTGNTVTFVVVGSGGQLGADGGPELSRILECVDNAGTAGLVGACKVISQ